MLLQEALGENLFPVHLGCWQHMVPCGYWIEACFFCYLPIVGWSQLLRAVLIHCFMASFSILKAAGSSESGPSQASALLFHSHFSLTDSAAFLHFEAPMWLYLSHLHNPGYSPYFKIYNLIPSAKAPFHANSWITKLGCRNWRLGRCKKGVDYFPYHSSLHYWVFYYLYTQKSHYF